MKFRINLPKLSIPKRKKAKPRPVKKLSVQERIEQMKAELIAEHMGTGKIKGNFEDYIEPRLLGINHTQPDTADGLTGAVVTSIAGLIGLLILSTVTFSLNTSLMSSATTQMLNVVPLLLIGALIIGIIMATLMYTMR